MIITNYLCAFATGIALAVVGVATAQNPSPAPEKPATAPAPAPQPAAGDTIALSTLRAVNKHEIAAAELAQSKSVDAATMDYAKMLEKDHKANLEKVEEISKLTKTPLAESPDIKVLEDQTKSERERLAKLDGPAFQTAYLDAMIAGHADVLGKLDAKLLPGASDVAVQQHLRATRESVSRHLDKAKQLRGKH
jgi:putative membrane protein